jgi:hypothetical protein
MTLGLSAIVIPIIIEWLFRRRKRQIELPTLRYLLRNKEQEKVKREDLLLLLLRMVGLFLLALALARPVIRHGMVGEVRERNVVVLLDGTASTHQMVETTTAFGWAKDRASEMISRLPENATVTVALLTDHVQPVVKDLKDPETAAGKVKALRASSGAGSMRDGLEWLRRYLKESDEAEREIYIFSDFQRRTWRGSQDTEAKVREALGEVAAKHELYLVDLGGDAQFNYIVTDLRPEEWLMSARTDVTFLVTVEATGTVPDDANPMVTLSIRDLAPGADTEPEAGKDDEEGNEDEEGRESQGGKRTIPPTSKKAVLEFPRIQFPKAGNYLVEALLEGDKHQIDNRRLYLTRVPEDVAVLVLDETLVDDSLSRPGEGGATKRWPDSFYLARSIAPSWLPGTPKVSRFAAKVIPPSRVAYENLGRDYAAVVLTGMSFLREDMVGKLETYVDGGGALWIFLGDRVNLFEYNKLLYKDGAGLLPAKLKSKVAIGATDGVIPDLAGTRLPAAGQLPETNSPDNLVMSYIELEVPGESPAGVMVKLSNDAPMIVEKRFGRGRVLLCNVAPTPDSTFWLARPEFPVFVQETLRYLVPNPDARVNLTVGDRFRQPVFVSPQHLLLRCPDRRKVRVKPIATGEDSWQVVFEDTTAVGMYEFDAVEEVLPRRQFVVNQSAEEGDLARLQQDDFANAFGEGGYEWISPQMPLAEYVERKHSVTELHPWLLWALVVALAGESLLAARFGRRRGGVTA